MKHKRNELLEPRSNVNELIAALRQVRGEEMYLMTKDTISQGTNHHHGDRASTTAPAGITRSVADDNVIAQRTGATSFGQPDVVRTFDEHRQKLRRGEEEDYDRTTTTTQVGTVSEEVIFCANYYQIYVEPR